MTTAAKYLASKPVVTTTLSSREITEHVPRALRENAMFSARTIYAEHLAQTQADILEILDGNLGAAEVRTRMGLRLKKLGYNPEPQDEGGLQDLSSDLRTNLILDHQTKNARGYAVWRSQQDDALLKVWPAQRLVRGSWRRKPRDWRTRWNDARRELGEENTTATYATTEDGPFEALKNDPIWTHPGVNRFGNSWTPFDWNSGMVLRQMMADEAREKKILTDDNAPAPRRDPMEYVQVSSAASVPAPILDEWVKPYGRRARVIDNKVAVTPHPDVVKAIVDTGKTSKANASAVFGYVPQAEISAISKLLGIPINDKAVFRIDADNVRHINRQHGLPHTVMEQNQQGKLVEIAAGERQPNQVPLSFEDIAAVPWELEKPGMWKLPKTEDKQSSAYGKGVEYENEDGVTVFCRIRSGVKTPKMQVTTMYKKLKADQQVPGVQASGLNVRNGTADISLQQR